VALPEESPSRPPVLYGLIGKMTAAQGRRDELSAILLEGTRAMPGCLSYVIAADPTEPDALWITEVWESRESHGASLALPAVQAAIARGRPLIVGMSDRVETQPLGGYGIPRALRRGGGDRGVAPPSRGSGTGVDSPG
jgi:quinol monooxygenase YgiN